MPLTSNQVLKILGSDDLSFTLLGLSMLITRLKRVYSQTPTPAKLTSCTEEINRFLEKYSNILGDDKKLIENL